jgi:hypothetical protein
MYTSFIHHTSVGRANKNTVNSEGSDENDTVDRRVIRVHNECAYQLLSMEQMSHFLSRAEKMSSIHDVNRVMNAFMVGSLLKFRPQTTSDVAIF